MWLDEDPACTPLPLVLGEAPYDYATIESAPWYDPDRDQESRDFYGMYVLSVRGLEDSTLQADVVERTGDGAVIGAQRNASRSVRIRVWLSAANALGIQYGFTWLKSMLSPDACGMHGSSCGKSDFAFFADCPPERMPTETDAQYALRVDHVRRYLHDVACTGAPFIIEDRISTDGESRGRLIEFTLTSELAWVFGATRPITIPPTVPLIVQDIASNLAPYPSAELAGASLIVARNLSPNPSLETNVTGWSHTNAAVSGAAPGAMLTGGRNNDVAAVGAWSYRARILGDAGATPVANAVRDVTILAPAVALAGYTDARPSVNLWAAALVLAGAGGSAIQSVRVDAIFTGGGAPIVGGSITTTDPADFPGRAYDIPSIDIPAGYTTMQVSVTFRVRWSSSATPANNSDVRLYADANAVTIP